MILQFLSDTLDTNRNHVIITLRNSQLLYLLQRLILAIRTIQESEYPSCDHHSCGDVVIVEPDSNRSSKH
jgi:hypothetical protein